MISIADKSVRKALDEISELFNYLRVWKIESHVFVDALMPPTEYYHRNLYFQVLLDQVSVHIYSFPTQTCLILSPFMAKVSRFS